MPRKPKPADALDPVAEAREAIMYCVTMYAARGQDAADSARVTKSADAYRDALLTAERARLRGLVEGCEVVAWVPAVNGLLHGHRANSNKKSVERFCAMARNNLNTAECVPLIRASTILTLLDGDSK